MNGLLEFFKQVKTEAKKVNWPTREDTIKNTLIVVGFSMVVAALLGFFDFVLGLLRNHFIS